VNKVKDYVQRRKLSGCFTAYDRNSDITGDSQDSPVGIATGYVLDGRGIGVRVPVGSSFSPLHVVQTSPGTRPASYPLGAGAVSPGGKAAGE
jgi:hypothetical protein